MITAVFCALILVETLGFHFLVALWSDTTAWILSLSSVYALFFLVAQYKASAGLPLMLTPKELHLKNGLKGSAVLPLQLIRTAVQTSSSALMNKGKVMRINALGHLVGHNVILLLEAPLKVSGMWGRTTTYEAVALELDDPTLFMSTLEGFREAQK